MTDATDGLEYYFASNDPTLAIKDEAPEGSVTAVITEGFGAARRVIAIGSPVDTNTPLYRLFSEGAA